jgi:GNAT superfamily N-acetyltransferase
VVIDYLAHHKELIPEITGLIYEQWSDLFQAAGTSKDDLAVLISERATTQRLPITVVALDGGALAGTGSIKLSEPGTKPGLSPWLAGMYVKEAYRGRGVGALLVRALEATAKQLDIDSLYLSVGTAEQFYRRLGWTVLERVNSYGVKDVALMTKQLDANCRWPDAHEAAR